MSNKCRRDLYVVYCVGKCSIAAVVFVKERTSSETLAHFPLHCFLQTQDNAADFCAYGILTLLL
jgi:NADH:ubiquinone oxidoreductase subunit E